jgi:hypothetical protein
MNTMFGLRAISAECADELSDIDSNGAAQPMMSVAILCSKWPNKSWGMALPVDGERRNIDTSERKRRQAAGREFQAAISALGAARSTFGWLKTDGKTARKATTNTAARRQPMN